MAFKFLKKGKPYTPSAEELAETSRGRAQAEKLGQQARLRADGTTVKDALKGANPVLAAMRAGVNVGKKLSPGINKVKNWAKNVKKHF